MSDLKQLFIQRDEHYVRLTKEIMGQLEMVVGVMAERIDQLIADRTEWRDASVINDEVIVVGVVPFTDEERVAVTNNPDTTPEMKKLVQTSIIRISIPIGVFQLTNRADVENYFDQMEGTTSLDQAEIIEDDLDLGDESPLKYLFGELTGFDTSELTPEQMQQILDFEESHGDKKH